MEHGARPAWKALKGVARVTAEFKHVAAGIGNVHPFISDITVKDDNINCWQLRLKDFDDEVPGGAALNQDLARLQQQYGQDHILLEISFPDDYPTHPFFMRMVSPRCVMYTGHVTAGGSICVEALTCSGTPGSWQADYSVEGLINLIVINMIDCPVAVVQTLTGPGGTSGPLRVDFNCGNPTRPYSSAEAQAAFSRTLQNHQRLGWDGAGAGGAGGAGPSGSAGLGAGSLGAAISAGPTPEAAAQAAAAAAAAVAALGDISRAAAHAKEDAGEEGAGLDGKHSAEARVPAALIRQHKARYAAYLWRKEREAEQGVAVAAAGGSEQAGVQLEDPAAQQHQQQRKKRQIVKQISDGKRPRSATADAETDADADAMEADCRGDLDMGTNTGADLDSQTGSEPEGADNADANSEEDSDADDLDGADGLQGQQQPRQSLRQRIAAAQASAAAALPGGAELAAAAGAGADAAADAAQGARAAPAAAAAAAGGAGGIAGALSQLLYTNMVTTRLPLRIRLKGPGGVGAQQQAQQGGAAAAAPPAAAAAAPVQALAAAVGNAAAAAATGGAGPMDQDVGGAEADIELPAHWDVNPYAPAGFELIDLEGHHSLSPLLDKASTAQGHTHQQLKALMTQGLSKYDAVAALLLEKGDLQDAMLRAFAYAGKKQGTVVNIWVNKCPNVPEAQKKAHNNNAEMNVIVNQLIASSGGAINKERVVRVERVQNPMLWRRFARKRQEILDRRGAEGLNERLVFHGSSPAAIANIVATGFDLTKASANGAYGQGHYFAELSTTALTYCNKGGGFSRAALVAQAMAAAGGGGAANALAAAAQQQEEDHWQMIVARVPLGSQTLGRNGLTQTPEGFDSVNSGSHRVVAVPAAANVGNLYCHVVFDNDQCYPEYVVTLKKDAHMRF